MAIYNSSERPQRITVDLNGPEGNAFVLLGLASRIYKKLNPLGIKDSKSWSEIETEMTSGDYENLITVFDHYFGDYVDMYR